MIFLIFISFRHVFSVSIWHKIILLHGVFSFFYIDSPKILFPKRQKFFFVIRNVKDGGFVGYIVSDMETVGDSDTFSFNVVNKKGLPWQSR